MSADEIETYIAAARPEFQGALTEIRQRIASILTEMGLEYTERMSYGVPGFAVGGKMVAGYAAFKHKCGYYPHSGQVLPQLGALIGKRSHEGSALHFTPDDPLPDPLLRKALALRLDEISKA